MKKQFYYYGYHILLFLSNRFNNRYINRLKIMVGSSLLLFTNQLLAQEHKGIMAQKTDSIAQDTVRFKEEDTIFCYVVEKMPSYPGGEQVLMEFIKKRAIYPQELEDSCIEGRIIVKFVVDEEGNIFNPVVVRSLHPLLDSIAVTIVKEIPKWEPGNLRGKPMAVKYTVPVVFSHSEGVQIKPQD